MTKCSNSITFKIDSAFTEVGCDNNWFLCFESQFQKSRNSSNILLCEVVAQLATETGMAYAFQPNKCQGFEWK